MNYISTVVKNHPEYVGRKLLLINMSKNGLFKENSGFYIEIEINNQGGLFVHKVSETLKRECINVSLRKIGEMYLGLKDPSVNQMLKYFVTPEMEIERIFNSLRYKYIHSLKSGNKNPEEYITYECNTLFKALAGLFIRGKGSLNNKIGKNLSKWGFKQGKNRLIDLQEEYNDLDFIIKYFRFNWFDNPNCKIKDKENLYKEIISIKPAFHEVFMDKKHGMEHKEGLENEGDDRRNITLKIIHGIYSDRSFDLKRLNSEVNVNTFISYATCNITEGPFISRKRISVSYFDEIRKIKTKKDLDNLKNNFYYLDYYHANLNTKEKLARFLIKAEKFRYFI